MLNEKCAIKLFGVLFARVKMPFGTTNLGVLLDWRCPCGIVILAPFVTKCAWFVIFTSVFA
jgi:hypothetical protein